MGDNDTEGMVMGHMEGKVEEETARSRRTYIYAIAGRNRGETLGTAERLCLETRTWERVPMLQEPRGSHGAAAMNGTVYAIAGGGMKSNLVSCEAFDETGDWRFVAPLDTPRHALAVASSRSYIYAVGGWANGDVCSRSCESFDPNTGVWTKCADLITGRRLHGAAVVNERLYVFGGASEDAFTIGSAECYEPQTDTWHSCADMPASCYTSAASVGNFIYVFLWGRYLTRYCPSEDKYTKLCDLPMKQWFGFAVTDLGTSIYCMGGVAQGQWKGWVYRYDTEDNTWHELPRMLAVRRRCAATACVHEGTPTGKTNGDIPAPVPIVQ